jgi:hypothetical protein
MMETWRQRRSSARNGAAAATALIFIAGPAIAGLLVHLVKD